MYEDSVVKELINEKSTYKQHHQEQEEHNRSIENKFKEKLQPTIHKFTKQI